MGSNQRRLRRFVLVVRTAIMRVVVEGRRPPVMRRRLVRLRLRFTPMPSRLLRLKARRTPTPRMADLERRRIPQPLLSLGETRIDIGVYLL